MPDVGLGGKRLLAAGAARNFLLVRRSPQRQAASGLVGRLGLPLIEQQLARLQERAPQAEVGQHQRGDSGDQRQDKAPIGHHGGCNTRGFGADAGRHANDVVRRQGHALSGDRNHRGAGDGGQSCGDCGRQQDGGDQGHRRRRPEEQ
jgi:hypothetical protein